MLSLCITMFWEKKFLSKIRPLPEEQFFLPKLDPQV
ncbi:hypothetical protein IAE36_003225 [Pseudomonas sp. S36]|nr:hypothetical protein [Pseudomonas sp. S36]